MPNVKLALSQNPEADRLLSDDPLALLIGMVLDQQVPLEWAFDAPLELRSRLGGTLDVKAIAAMDGEKLGEAFSARPALHRYPGSMAGRVHALCQTIVAEYGADPAAIWTSATTGKELYTRIKALPGFGDHKARIFVALLGKQLGVRPEGWDEVSAPFSAEGSLMSVADIVNQATLDKVRDTKQAAKREAKAAAAASASAASAVAKNGARPKAATAGTKKAAPAKAKAAKTTSHNGATPPARRASKTSPATAGATARSAAAAAARRRTGS